MAQQEEQLPRGSGERRLWRWLGALVAVALLAEGAGQAWAALAQQNTTTTAAFPDSVTALDLDLEDGAVTVAGGSQTAVTVRQNLNWTRRRPHVEQTLSGHVLTIKVRCPRLAGFTEPGCGAALDIKAPTATAVTVRMTSGQTTITGVSGDLSLRATSGDVELDNVSGRIAARVFSGRIGGTHLASASVRAEVTSGEAALDFTTAPDDLVLSAISGSVGATLPKGSHYTISTHGGVEFDPAMVDSLSPHTIAVSAASGKGTLGYGAG